MTIADALRAYLKNSGESMRSLSLRAGLTEKTVSDILRLKGLQPRYKTIEALTNATGVDFGKCQQASQVTYQEVIDQFILDGEPRKARRIKWLVKSARWVPQTRIVCRREAVEFLEANNAAHFGLSEGSFATYKCEAIANVTNNGVRNRKRNVTDLTGEHAEFQKALKDNDMEKWRVGMVGSFLVFLHDRDIALNEITTEILGTYFAHRLQVSAKSEEKCKNHVKEISSFLRIVSSDPAFSRFCASPAAHPFEKSNGKYGVDNQLISHLLKEYDESIVPWARGEISRDGMSRKDFIASLDCAETQITDKKALLLQRRKALAARPGQGDASNSKTNDDLLAASGFLTIKKQWNGKTLQTRRGYVASLAKSIVASVDIVPETLHELLDPDFLEVAVDAMKASNSGEFPSGYIGSVMKCVKKIVTSYQRRSAEEIGRITELLKANNRKRRGIAPRNRAKLRQFADKRIQMTIDLGDTIITGVNNEIDRGRTAHKRKHGVLPDKSKVINHEIARDVMAAIAHEILLRSAPRSNNLINSKLEWIAWIDGLAVMTIPAQEVKMRGADDDDLRIPLDERCSKLLRHYLDTVRAKALLKGDEKNPYLFPRQSGGALNQPYGNLLGRVTALLHKHVGISIHPHLYRHLIGWIWLKESLDNLPKVQRLLGHKSLQTTIDYYAELDNGLVFDEWQDLLNNKRGSEKHKEAA